MPAAGPSEVNGKTPVQIFGIQLLSSIGIFGWVLLRKIPQQGLSENINVYE